VDAREFLGVHDTPDPHRSWLEVVPRLCSDELFLFGGCALGASIAAMERATGRPLVWATAQFVSIARPPEVLECDVTVASSGHQTTQARVLGRVGEREILFVSAALGERRDRDPGQWPAMPEVPGPDESPGRVRPVKPVQGDDSLLQRLEMRTARGRGFHDYDGTRGDGRSALWVRAPEELEMSAAALAVLGDFVPFGVGQAVGEYVSGNSLDNTLRVFRIVPTEWVLVDVQIDAVHRGFGHGTVHLWAQDGTLLGTASQSCIVREWKGATRAVGADGGDDRGVGGSP
jgi:acyl-CoA thioesterase